MARLLGLDARPKENKLAFSNKGTGAVRIFFNNSSIKPYQLAGCIASWFGQFRSCLFWVTEFGIWPSNENLHLYYSLRSAYHDHRLLSDAPGHLFMSYEGPELITFLDLAIQFGWGGFLFGALADQNVTISHDEWIIVESYTNLSAVEDDCAKLSLRCELIRPIPKLDA